MQQTELPGHLNDIGVIVSGGNKLAVVEKLAATGHGGDGDGEELSGKGGELRINLGMGPPEIIHGTLVGDLAVDARLAQISREIICDGDVVHLEDGVEGRLGEIVQA